MKPFYPRWVPFTPVGSGLGVVCAGSVFIWCRRVLICRWVCHGRVLWAESHHLCISKWMRFLLGRQHSQPVRCRWSAGCGTSPVRSCCYPLRWKFKTDFVRINWQYRTVSRRWRFSIQRQYWVRWCWRNVQTSTLLPQPRMSCKSNWLFGCSNECQSSTCFMWLDTYSCVVKLW